MNSGPIAVSVKQAAQNQEFLAHLAAGDTTRYIRRHSLAARITHDATAIGCVLLVISGLFVFVPALALAAGPDVVWVIRMAHRIIGVIFVLIPIVSALLSPKGVCHIFRNLFAKWDSDDKKWMALFIPYLFRAKKIHMPDQHEIKSGQRVADGMLWFSAALMGVTGVLLLLGSTVVNFGPVQGAFLFLHDVGFLLISVFALAHIFLGSGIFQAYRGMYKVMWGDGKISESDALYHWGHWAREELASGKNVIEK